MSDIDQLAQVRREKAKLERLDTILTAKVTRLGFGVHDGDRYTAIVAEQERTALDQSDLQTTLPIDVWTPFVKTTTHVVVTLMLVARKS